MKHMIVTGGYGFIGSNFIHKMMTKHPDLVIINIDCQTYAANKKNLQGIDETRFVDRSLDLGWDWNIDSIKYLIDTYKPEWVVHFAAESHVDNSIQDQTPFLKTNIHGTIHLLEAIKKAKWSTKLLHVSTDEVYGSLPLGDDPDHKDTFMEHDTFHPNSPYAASKAAAECFVMAYGSTFNVPYIITNGSNTYGPRQHLEKFIPKVIDHALRGKYIPVYGNGENQRDWIHVNDVCSAIEMLMNKGIFGEKYNIGTPTKKLFSNNEIAKKIVGIVGADQKLITHVKDRLGHDLKYHVCSYKLQNLGWSPIVDLDQGLKQTIEWYKK